MRKIIDLALKIDYGRYYRFIVMVIIILKMTNKITTEWYWILALIWVPFVFWLAKDKGEGNCIEEDTLNFIGNVEVEEKDGKTEINVKPAQWTKEL